MQCEQILRQEVSPVLTIETCPLCASTLRLSEEAYSRDAIFAMWESAGVCFSDRMRSEAGISNGVSLHECCTCGFGIFLPPWHGSAEFYEQLGKVEDYYIGAKWEFKRALEDLRDCESVLEVGCGDGRFLTQLKCNHAVGLEYSPEAAARARARGLNVFNVTLEEFADQHESEFDGVCTFQVLEHVPDPIEFLRAMKKCLKPDGLMVLAVPNARGILRYLRPVPTDLPPHHLTRWEPRSFERLEKLGLQLNYLRREPLDAPRFHWLLRWWDHACGIVRDEHASWIENFRKHPLWLIGNVSLHYGLQLVRRVGVKELPVHGHSLYALLSKRS